MNAKSMSLALATIEKLQQILTVALVNIISIIKGVNNANIYSN